MAKSKSRATPYLVHTTSTNIALPETSKLEDHILHATALEAITSSCGSQVVSTLWSGAVAKRAEKGKLSIGMFRGKVLQSEKTGQPYADLTVERDLTMQAFFDEGLIEDFGRAGDEWENDDIALGVNFSRLHRMALLLENRAPEFLQGLAGRIDEDIRATDVYPKMIKAAELRKVRSEEEREAKHQQWLVDNAAREEAARIRAAEDRVLELAKKRKYADLIGHTFANDEALDFGVTIGCAKTVKAYENDHHKPMPADFAAHGPFSWGRVGYAGKRIFFDNRGLRVPEPV